MNQPVIVFKTQSILKQLEYKLGSKRQAHIWLYTPNDKLNGLTPFCLLSDQDEIDKLFFIVSSLKVEEKRASL